MATANLSVESKDFTLPVVEATAGADGIVVSTLRNDGWVTLDPGFLTTAQCESKITYIDGKNSILRYRGYPIEQLCEQSDFLEVAWLLRHGELPNKDQYDRFISDINHRTMVGEDFRTFMGSFPRTAHPMSVMASAVNALATFYPDTTDINDSDQLDEAALKKLSNIQGELSSALSRLMAISENYPDLKANQNFLDLQAQLEGTENRIAVERRKFNDVARSYNAFILQFPRNLVAGMFGFTSKPYFEANAGAENAPKVEF